MSGSRKDGWGHLLLMIMDLQYISYRKVPKFSDTRKLCCKQSKIQTKSFFHGVIPLNDANGIANSEDPDQTAPLGAV